MRTYKVELSIDVPDQYEFSRLLKKDTASELQYLALEDGEIILETISFRGEPYWVVVRKAWQWPKWLTANYIAMDGDNQWWAFTGQPEQNPDEEEWYPRGEKFSLLDSCFIAFSPPPCNNWQESLRKNPNCE
jgi:hypothetical protein